MSEVEIKSQFIAYLDILGYDKHIGNGKALAFYNLIKSIVNDIRTIQKNSNNSGYLHPIPNCVNIKMFSDNLIICSERNWQNVLNFSHMIQQKFMQNDVFVRGSLYFGELLFDDEFVLGQGLIDAYKIESEIAIFPRIIVDQTFIVNAEEEIYQRTGHRNKISPPKNESDINYSQLRYDHCDENIFIDYLSSCIFESFHKTEYIEGEIIKRVVEQNENYFADIIYKHKKIVKKNIEENINDIRKMKILQKYQWCKNYHNNYCSKYNQEYLYSKGCFDNIFIE